MDNLSLVKPKPSVTEIDELDEKLFINSVFSKKDAQSDVETQKSETTLTDEKFSVKMDIININLVFDQVESVVDFEKTDELELEKNEQLKVDIYWFVLDNPGKLTSDIVENFNSFDTWEILEILDELKDEGLVE